jgi:predicted neuraminidase
MRLAAAVSFLVVACVVTRLGGEDGFQKPPKAEPGVGAVVSAEFVYPLEGRQTPQCHASTIAETSTGLVAAWFGGKHEKNNDVGIWCSRQVDGKWTKPVEVASGAEDEDQDYPCWNPVLFQPKTGPLWLFYKVGPSPSSWWGVAMASTDGGKTWSGRHRLGTDKKLGEKNPNLIGPVKNKPIQLADGTLLCPSSSEHQRWRVHFEVSKDLGKTWRVIGPINDGSKFGAIQPSILSYKNGSMQVLCRTQQGVIAESWSTDGGASWSQLASSGLPNPNAGTDAVTLADGRQLLVYNHTTRGGGLNGRQMLNVAISDDGKSWRPILTLEDNKKRSEYSYPAVIQARDGAIHIAYTWKRITVKHVVLDPTKLK